MKLNSTPAPGIEILLLRLGVEGRHHCLVGRRRRGGGRLQELRGGRVGVHAVLLLEGEAVLAVVVAVGGIAGCKRKEAEMKSGGEASKMSEDR